MYNTYRAHTCKYLVNWRDYTERDLNLKWPDLGSFDILKLIFFACTIRQGQPCFDWYLEASKTGNDTVVAARSRKQTHSGQCRQWSAVYYTGGPKAEAPLSQGPRPVFVKTLYTVSVLAQTHLPKFLETSLDKVKERYDQS